MSKYYALILGASSGFGKAIALAFAKEGCNIVLNYHSSLDDETVQEIEACGVTCMPVQGDVSDFAFAADMMKKVKKELGSVDILVNNAGLSMRALFKDLDLSVMKRLMDVNFWGCVYCTKYALPWLLESKGSVVGVTSIAGFSGLPARTGYSASKFAMNGFLDTLRTEHLYDGLHVMTFAPGFTSSNVRIAALSADGTPQGTTPRAEEKMMTAEECANHIYNAVVKRKRTLILTVQGKVAVWLNKLWPSLAERLVYNAMAKEPNAPVQ